MKMKRIVSFSSTLLLSLSSLLVLNVPKAFAATKTWDGGGSDTNMNTAANWAGDSAPSAGDDLVFPANVTNRTVVNNYTAATSFNSITFSGTATSESGYTISGNSITLVAGITASVTGEFGSNILSLPIQFSGNQSLSSTSVSPIFLNGVVSGSGNLTKGGAGVLGLTATNTFTGTLTVTAGTLSIENASALGNSSAGTSIASGALLSVCHTDNLTIAEPLTLAGDGTNESVTVGACAGGSGSGNSDDLATFSGTLTLQSNILLGGSNGNDGKFTGAITGSFTISVKDGANATWELASSSNGSQTPNGVLTSAAAETTYADNSPSTTITVSANNTAIVTGTYGDVIVHNGGTLKGTGTVGDTTVNSGGKLAPGLSPGCLNTGNLTFTEGAIYDFEIAGNEQCTEYDQIRVTGTVTLGNGTLNTILPAGVELEKDMIFLIINNDESDAVDGTFLDLAEGATVNVNGSVFKVSYTGGDGNDVTLTVVTVGAPNTGLRVLMSNPLAILAATTLAAGAILLISRRLQAVTVRR